MMDAGIKVRVEWAPAKRVRLPKSSTYSTVAKFPEDVKWPSEAWSIVVSFDEGPAEGSSYSKGRARFLSAEGPYERLVTGKVFELFEGSERTATVLVL